MKVAILLLLILILAFTSSTAFAQNKVVVIPLGGGTKIPAPVPKTGQSFIFHASDDGSLQKGVSLPSPRFTKNNNGTVTDNLTGLIWLAKANCILTDNVSFDVDNGDGKVTWAEAFDFIAGINTGTYNCGDTSNGGTNQTDWRLPNRLELLSLVNLDFFNPTLSNAEGTGIWTDGNAFSDVDSSGWYWSSSSQPIATEYAFGVEFSQGNNAAQHKTIITCFVWPVRGGQ